MTNSPSPQAVSAALHDADCVSGRIAAGGYRANLSDVECLRNHVRKLAALASRASPADGVVVVPREELALALDRLTTAATVVRRLLHNTPEVQGPAFKDAGVSFVSAIDNARAVLRRHDAASPALTATSGGGEDKGNHDCLAKRRPGEPMFILLGRDPDAHNIVQIWADRRLAAGGDPDHCRMGYDTAERMKTYASDPANKPASAPDSLDYATPPSADADKLVIAREAFEEIEKTVQITRVKHIARQALARLSTTEAAATPADAMEGEGS